MMSVFENTDVPEMADSRARVGWIGIGIKDWPLRGRSRRYHPFAACDLGFEEAISQNRYYRDRIEDKDQQHHGDKGPAMSQDPLQRFFVTSIESLISATTPIHQCGKPGRHGPPSVLFRLEELVAKRRRHCAGDEEGREERNRDGHG